MKKFLIRFIMANIFFYLNKESNLIYNAKVFINKNNKLVFF